MTKEEDIVISLSTTFHPGNPAILSTPDIILSSNDGVLFYLNSQLLATAGFDVQATTLPAPGLDLSQEAPVQLPDSSLTLSIIFHALYDISCLPFSPSLDAISHAMARMEECGLTPSSLIQAGTHLYIYLMAQYAPFSPLELYTIPAKHSIERLAVDISSHLLGLDLSKVTDELANTMGSSYLRRLFFMYQGRMERLKKILIKPPSFHENVVEECNPKTRALLRRQWALMATSLVWDANPGRLSPLRCIYQNILIVGLDISPFAIQQTFRLAGRVTSCTTCKASWADRVQVVGTEWAGIKVSRHCHLSLITTYS